MKHRYDTLRKAVKGLDLPADTFFGGARLEIVGNYEVSIDGCKGILDYSDTLVKISTGKSSLSITGTGLLISRYIEESMIVTGNLAAVNFNV